MPIWEDEEYQAQLQEQIEGQARKWLKKKIDESRGIVKTETCYD